MNNKQVGKHDDFRRMHMDEFEGVADVFQYDATLEVYLYGENVTEDIDKNDVSIPLVQRTY